MSSHTDEIRKRLDDARWSRSDAAQMEIAVIQAEATISLVEATEALVEQQRIGNLIAYQMIPGIRSVRSTYALLDVEERLGLGS